METYVHNVKFYETDQMRITHHSNYVRWMEEARLHFLKSIGCDYRELDELGISSPVVMVNVKYLKPTVFDDDVTVNVTVEKFTGVRFVMNYEMTCGGHTVCSAKSEHAFFNAGGRVVNLRKAAPEYCKRFDMAVTE